MSETQCKYTWCINYLICFVWNALGMLGGGGEGRGKKKGGVNLNIGEGLGQESNLNVWREGRNLKVWGAGGQENFS